MQLKVNLKLQNLPISVGEVSAKFLRNNDLVREYGQLVNLKLARVVSVSQPS